MSGRHNIGFDISPVAYNVSLGKVSNLNKEDIKREIQLLSRFIEGNEPNDQDFKNSLQISFNKTLIDYYHKKTFNEILLSREYS